MPTESNLSPGTPLAGHPAKNSTRVALLYKRDAQPDEQMLRQLEDVLVRSGYSVFVDRHLLLGMEWAKEIEHQIRTADAVVPLLSETSIQSEMMAFEIEIAHETAQTHRGRPKLLPVRVNYSGPLPEPLAGILNPIQYILWQNPADNQRLGAELLSALESLPSPQPPDIVVPTKGIGLVPRPVAQPRAVSSGLPVSAPALEPVGGAVPIDSEFYLVRPADVELRNALTRHDAIVLIKGARQMGKTSLLARGLKFAREYRAKVAMTDFQKFNASNFETVGNLQLTLAESLADQLGLSVLPGDVWDERRGPNVNFERYLRREVLSQLEEPLVWGLDEVDRLFACPYASEIFGLFRSWHNERALDPPGPWSRLTLVIAYATEAHLFITDVNQSPFNVGTRLVLEDFWPDQVAELNQRYGSPLKDKEELNRFIRLVGGHPFLVRRGLYELTKRRLALAALEEKAPRDEGIYGDHLRRILVLLAKDPALTEVVRGILRGQPCPTAEDFYRLRSAGVMSGTSPSDVRPRCQLYVMYLSRHLLG